MPNLSALGSILHGRDRAWLDDSGRVVEQQCDATACRIMAGLSPAGPWTKVADRGCSAIAAGAGRWLAHLVGYGVFGPDGLLPGGEAMALGADYNLARGLSAPDGTIAVILEYQRARGLRLVAADGTFVDYPDARPMVTQVAVVDRTRAVFWDWERNHIATVGGLAVPSVLPGIVDWPTVLDVAGELWILYQTRLPSARIVLHPYDDCSSGYEMPAGFYPDAVVLPDGRVLAAWAFAADDAGGNSRLIDVASEPRVALGGPGPTIPVTDTAPHVKPWPRKLWVAPFFSHSERYGDTPLERHAGNAIVIVEDEADPATIHRDLDRVRPLGVPMIVGAQQPIADVNINTTVAWWASGGTADQLGAAVARVSAFVERPVIAYLDGDSWPAARPTWLTDRVWPAVQAYRHAGEPLNVFAARLDTVLGRVSSYGQPITLTPRFDDADLDAPGYSLEQTLACMPLYDRWIRDHQIVCVMPFADRRGHGMTYHPELRAWARAFVDATVARPNRFDYWIPSNGDLPAVLRNKLGQTVEMIVLSAREKQFLLSLVEGK